MSGFDKVSTEDLRAELARREEQPRRLRPPARTAPGFEILVKVIVEGFDRTECEGFIREKLRGEICEAAIEAVYGPEIWSWLTRFS